MDTPAVGVAHIEHSLHADKRDHGVYDFPEDHRDDSGGPICELPESVVVEVCG
jgi:hypothetical protein